MPEPRKLSYNVGDTHASGGTIKFVCGHSREVIVFLDSSDLLQWETASDVLTDVQRKVHLHFDRVHDALVAWIPAARRRPHIHALGSALFLALSDPDEDKALAHFETPSGRILQEAQRQGRLAYFVAGTFGAVAVSAIGLAVFALVGEGTIRDVGVGLVAASFGAWTSILQRSSKLRLDPYETPSNLRFQGATRIGLGVVFGLVAIAAIHANVLVPSAAANAWLAAIVVFVAGFSERLMPELLSRFEGKGAHLAQPALPNPEPEV